MWDVLTRDEMWDAPTSPDIDTALCSITVADTPPPRDPYGVAYALCDAGQYRKAQPFIERFLAGEPESWRGWCVASWAAHSIGDATAGLEYGARAITLAPDEEWPVRTYALSLRGLGRLGRSLEFARKAVELEPNEVLAWRCFAESARYFGLPEEAIRAANRASTIAPDSVHAMHAWVTAAEVMERTEGIKILLSALERDPSSVFLLHELAVLYSCERRFSEALDLFERVLRQQPRHRDARNWYLAVRAESGLASDANQLTREYFEEELRSSILEIEHRPTDFRPYVRSSDFAHRLGRLEESLAFARKASLHPPGEQYVGVWRVLALSACALQEWELAHFAIDEAYKLDPDSPYRWLELAEVSLLARDTERSISWAQRVIDEQPSCMYVLKARAIVAHCVEDFEEASLCLGQYLERFPLSSCNASHLAHCRAELGDHIGALEAWRKSTSWDPFCACEWRQLAETTMTRVGITLAH